MPVAATGASHSGYFELRADLLGASRTRVLVSEELVTASRLIYGHPEGLSLYGVSASHMAERNLRFLGRTATECSVDVYVRAVAEPCCRRVRLQSCPLCLRQLWSRTRRQES